MPAVDPRPVRPMKRLLSLLVLLLAPGWALSEGVAPFVAGDRWVCVGDSITHGGGYHSNVYLFYATRRPNDEFRVYNAGVSGDTTPGANRRFEEDVAARRPSVATVLLGMNDAWSHAFDPGLSADQKRASADRAYAVYASEMDRLAASLEGLGVRTVFLTPTVYDQTAESPVPNLVGRDDLLARFAERLRTIAPRHGGELVDFHKLLGRMNRRLQADDPTATIIGRDRVHPGDPGHLVMAYALLKAQGPFEPVSEIVVDAKAGEVRRQTNCAVSELDTVGALSFTCLENALPFPVGASQSPALELVPFQRELNRQTLQVTGLAPGRHRLEIDGQTVDDYDAAELAAGVNLSDNALTPQHDQAMEVKRANHARLAVVSKLRSMRHVRHAMVPKLDPPVSESDREALAAALAEHVEKSNAKPWYGYLKREVKRYLEALPEEASLRRQEEALMRRIWVVNQPKPHAWELRPIEE